MIGRLKHITLGTMHIFAEFTVHEIIKQKKRCSIHFLTKLNK